MTLAFEKLPHYEDIDLGIAFCIANGDDVRYMDLGRRTSPWLAWDGRRWQRVSTVAIERLAKATSDGMCERAVELCSYDGDHPLAIGANGNTLTRRRRHEEDDLADGWLDAFEKLALRSRSTRGIDAMLTMARSEAGIEVVPGDLDVNPLLLNLTNGTLDLETYELRPHDRGDLLTKLAGTEFHAGATCPPWEHFVYRMFGDADTVAYVQRMCGLLLTGFVDEKAFFLLQGPTNTGKSTFVKTLHRVLGEYAVTTSVATLLVRDVNAVRNDLADLVGARLVTAGEAEEGQRFAVPLLKQLSSGGDALKVRRLFEEYFEFVPTFKLLLDTNELPKLSGGDDAAWNRVRRIVTQGVIDRPRSMAAVVGEFEVESAGILNWMVAGLRDYRESGGLVEPESVIAATSAYRYEQDHVKRFADERLVEGNFVPASDVYAAWQRWAQGTGLRPHENLNAVEFGRELTRVLRVGSTSTKVDGRGVRVYRGWELRGVGANA